MKRKITIYFKSSQGSYQDIRYVNQYTIDGKNRILEISTSTVYYYFNLDTIHWFEVTTEIEK